ncbi:uncharacterized protein N7459_000836 [Penicillium hispanicum]|uniref:uncharacterized protein n=1 Tax=Penicillium hispanicum TaxID=1080232 RepID=UPI002540A307|nr:uncharacterized protein N7459_000836 [Penicillium hispanicum]KAJ5594628.1 hypothetical protein N7459_000836 [Penicillium hispanicum]
MTVELDRNICWPCSSIVADAYAIPVQTSRGAHRLIGDPTDSTAVDAKINIAARAHTCVKTLSDSAMAAPTSLKLEPVTLDDVPAITELWFATFTDPDMQHLFPDTPNIRQWWDDANRQDLLNKPFQKYLKIVDPECSDDQGRPRLAAYAKWDTAMVDERGRRFPPWHADTPASDADALFNRFESNRRRVMGDEKHYCKGTSFARCQKLT